jgi:hypothetical protein
VRLTFAFLLLSSNKSANLVEVIAADGLYKRDVFSRSPKAPLSGNLLTKLI